LQLTFLKVSNVLKYFKKDWYLKILPICYQSRGFLIIELLVALGLLASLAILITKYQLQIGLYQKAAQELYQAVALGESEIEELWSTNRVPLSKTKQVNQFTVTVNCIPILVHNYYRVQIAISWLTVLNHSQKINLEVICVA